MADLLEFASIKLHIPRREILRDLKKHYLTRKKFFKYCKLKTKVEATANKIAHVNSVLERILLKTYEYKP